MTGSSPTDWIKLVADLEQEAHAKELARLKSASDTRASGSKPSLALASYEGQYEDPWYGIMHIQRNGNKLRMSFSRTPDLTGEMEHFQHDTFIVRWKERNFNADAYVTFSLDHDGSIDNVKMKAVSEETDFSYDFHDLRFTPVKAQAAKL